MTDEAEFAATKRIIQAALDEYERSEPRPSGPAVAQAFAAATLAMWRGIHGADAFSKLSDFLASVEASARPGR